jgi:hypothetical protein
MKLLTIILSLFTLVNAVRWQKPLDYQDGSKYTIAHPGSVEDIILTTQNTLNTTSSDTNCHARVLAARLPIRLVNNFSGGSLTAYISGLDSTGRVVFIDARGQVTYPRSGGSRVPVPISQSVAIPLPPQGQTLAITLPIALSSGRVYFAEGTLQFFMVDIGNGNDGLVQPSIANLQDPSSGTNWGFVELTLTAEGVIWANISFVDFVGLSFGMAVRSISGTVREVLGLPAGAVDRLCSSLSAQGRADGRPWASHCIAGSNGRLLRVLSPNIYAGINPGAFSSYWTQYVDQVWQYYRTNPLYINTQSASGLVSCRVVGDLLQCAGDNRGYAKPSAPDIWGCNGGPFAIMAGDNAVHYAVVPRLCAAFVRTTLLLSGGNTQPGLGAGSYYTRNPTHHYSRLIHELEVDGKGYAFPYDDVNPTGAGDAAGLIAEGNPESLTFYVGGVRA